NASELYGAVSLSLSALAGVTYTIVADSAGVPGQYTCATGPFVLRLKQLNLIVATPAEGGQFTAPATIPITLGLEETENPILQAAFYVDSNLLGTAYSSPFSFIWSNAPPGAHQIQVVALNDEGVSVPSSAVSITVSPQNDQFTNRIVISGTSTNVPATLASASIEPGEPPFRGGHTVWWSWTAPFSGKLGLVISSFQFTTAVRLYTGTSLTNLLLTGENPYANAQAFFPVLSGQTYQIAVDSPSSTPGPFTFTLNFLPLPVNDFFADRIVLTNETVLVDGTSRGATADPLVPQDTGRVWYSWKPAKRGAAAINVTHNQNPVAFSIYRGTSFTNLVAVPGLTTTVGATQIDVQPGSEYFFVVGDGTDFQMSFVFAEDGSNDNFANRMLLTGLSVTGRFSNLRATAEVNEPNHAAFSSGKSLWWSWTAPIKGRVAIVATNSSFPATLAVYTNVMLGNLIQMDATPDGHVLRFDTRAGETYQIAVDTAYGKQPGILEVAINEDPPPGAPANDDFRDALSLAGSDVIFTASNTNATTEPGEPSHVGCLAHSAWWSWNPPASGMVTLTRIYPSASSVLEVYAGSNLNSLVTQAALPGNTSERHFPVVAGKPYYLAFDSCSASASSAIYSLLLSTVTISPPTNAAKILTPGPIMLHANQTPIDGSLLGVTFIANGQSIGTVTGPPFQWLWTNQVGGAYSLEARAVGIDGRARWAPAVSLQFTPPNDDFANRIQLAGDRILFNADNRGASFETNESSLVPNASHSSVWWNWTPPRSGWVRINAGSFSFQPFLQMFTGDSISDLSPVNYERIDAAPPRIIVASVTAGTPYSLALNGRITNGLSAAGAFGLSLFEDPTNNLFSFRTLLEGSNLTWRGWTHLSSMEPGEPMPRGWNETGRTVWATWTAPATGTMNLDLYNLFVTSGTHIGAYSGSNLSNLVLLADNLQDGISRTHVSFRAEAGKAYQFRFGTPVQDQLETGLDFELTLAFVPEPVNDNFANRLLLSGTHATSSVPLASASSEPGEPNHNGLSATRSVWWSWIAPDSGRVALVLKQGSTVLLSNVAVYTGDSLTNLTAVPLAGLSSLPGAARRFYTNEAASFSAAAGVSYQIAVDAVSSFDTPVTFELILSRTEITSPSNGAIWLTPTNAFISAHTVGSDPDVSQVTFHVLDLQSIERWTAVAFPPLYNLVWSNPPPNDYVIVAEAKDNSAQKSFSRPVTVSTRITNDRFQDALSLSGADTALFGFNTSATSEPGEPLLQGATGGTIWWAWTAPADGTVTITNIGSINAPDGFGRNPTNGPAIAVYTGSTLETLSLMARNNYQQVLPGPQRPPRQITLGTDSLSFPASAGIKYYISVDGLNGAKGSVQLQLTMAKVRLTDPPFGSVYASASNILLRADALELDEAINRLDFLAGTNLLGSVTSRPFEMLWQAPFAGVYELRARVIHASGVSAVSDPVNIRVGNDDYARRLLLTGTNILVQGNNIWASLEPGESAIGGWPQSYNPFGVGKTLWFTWSAPGNGLMVVDVFENQHRPVVSILAGDDLSNLTRLSHNGFARCNSCDGCVNDTRSQTSLTVTNGQACQIAVDSLDFAGVGQFQFRVRLETPPANDNFATREVLAGTSVDFAVNTTTGTAEPDEPNPATNAFIHSVWYSWTAPASGRLTISGTSPAAAAASPKLVIIVSPPCSPHEVPAAPPFQPVISAFRGENLSALSLVASSDSVIAFHTEAGVTYHIAVDGYGGSTGSTNLHLAFSARPANDDFYSRYTLSGASPFIQGDNFGATLQEGEVSLDLFSQGQSVWWSWTAPSSGSVHIGNTWPFSLGV
ncbi:MAG: hypothetical protein JWM16_392, partial [Verrucomicrobiales bacterium]|nr:hypothetical protein [Verrucomicrobiales bacterium]